MTTVQGDSPTYAHSGSMCQFSTNRLLLRQSHQGACVLSFKAAKSSEGCLQDHVPTLQAIWERVKSHRGSTASMQGHGSKDLQQRTPYKPGDT